jgi:hypothetical protein
LKLKKDINETAAMKEFCGSGKRISPSIIQEIDQKKKAAKDAGNLKLSKEYKQQYVCLKDSESRLTQCQASTSFDQCKK